jgi:hypothetical protein
VPFFVDFIVYFSGSSRRHESSFNRLVSQQADDIVRVDVGTLRTDYVAVAVAGKAACAGKSQFGNGIVEFYIILQQGKR